MISTDKLDGAILKHLQGVQGVQDASLIWWQTRLQEQIGELPDYGEVRSAVKRLQADGVVHLKKYSEQLGGLYEYRGDGTDDDHWFFGFATFETGITDHGRRYWDVPRAPIGFRKPA